MNWAGTNVGRTIEGRLAAPTVASGSSAGVSGREPTSRARQIGQVVASCERAWSPVLGGLQRSPASAASDGGTSVETGPTSQRGSDTIPN